MDRKDMSILVIDDSPGDVALVSGILSECYKVKAVTRSQKAVAVAAAKPQPALILLDVLMPLMDGYELCKKLKSNLETRRIPIVFITGNITDEERWRGLEMGAEAYLTKPVDPERLLAVVQRYAKLNT